MILARAQQTLRDLARKLCYGTEAEATTLLLASMLVCSVLYVVMAFTPSSYALVLNHLGMSVHPLFLSPAPDRSDEYFLLTPLIQTAVRGGFAGYNLFSPYHETLKEFLALPILDWSLLFKPQLWGFWIVPPAYAYSLYFCIFWMAFLLGYTVLLTQLGAKPVIAALGTICLLYSGLVQGWWTTNAPNFAFAPLPVIVFLLKLRPLIKLPLLIWTMGVSLFGIFYPAFILTGAFALGVLLLAFRRDMLTPSNMALLVIALIVWAFLIHLYFGDLVAIMRKTIHPGQRVSSGGGVDPSQLISHLLPYFATVDLKPVLQLNFCSVSTVGTLLPLSFVCFVRYESAREAVMANARGWSIVGIGLLLMLAWMSLPVPAQIGRLLLWTYVPPIRMLWGFGLLLTLSVIILFSKAEFELSPRRMWAFAAVLICAGLFSKFLHTVVRGTTDLTFLQAMSQCVFDWVPILIFPLVTGAFRKNRPGETENSSARRLMIASACAGIITFGAYNPIQQAFPIFKIPETREIAELRRMALNSPNNWAIRPGGFGAVLSGLGIPAVNHTLRVPQIDFFRAVFPDLPEQQLNYLFNRYAHIVPLPGIKQPYLLQEDAVAVPIEAFTKKIDFSRPTPQ